MEEETLANSQVPVVKVDSVEVTTRDVDDEKEKEDDESAFDGEFIKIEKECVADEKPSANERSSSNSYPIREFLEAQEKVKELELKLLEVSKDCKHFESENTRLNDDVALNKEKLEESEKRYDELELSHQKLQKQISDAEDNYGLQISTLQAELQAQETKQKELIGVKEDFDNLHLEFESSKKKMLEVEQELQFSAGEAMKFEELHKKSGSRAELERQKALEFERLLEMAKLSAKEVEDQMAILQEEVKGLYEKIGENEKVEEQLRITTSELSTVQGEVEILKSQVVDLEKRVDLKEDLVNELKQELEAFQLKTSSLEVALQMANEREKELTEILKITIEEKINLGDALKTTSEKLDELENKAAQSFSEIELLVETITQLKNRNNELQESLNSVGGDREATSRQLEELHDQHAKASEMIESHKIERELAMTRSKNLESIVEELQSRSNHLEKECEGLAGVNLKLTQDSAENESKLNSLEIKFSAAMEELLSAKKAVKDLTQQLNSDREKFESQILSVMEENNQLNETHENAKKETQTVKLQLEGQLKEQRSKEDALKAEIENLKAKLHEKSELDAHLKKCEEQLVRSEARAKEAELKTDTDKKALLLLENQVKELEQKLQLAAANTNEKDIKASPPALKEGMDVKSRDGGSSISTPLQQRHKKNLEASSSSSELQSQTTEASPGMNFKFILGIALVSVIIGLILGKRY